MSKRTFELTNQQIQSLMKFLSRASLVGNETGEFSNLVAAFSTPLVEPKADEKKAE